METNNPAGLELHAEVVINLDDQMDFSMMLFVTSVARASTRCVREMMHDPSRLQRYSPAYRSANSSAHSGTF